MTGVSPCDLLTADQQREFGVDIPPRNDDDPTLRARTCHFVSRGQKTRVALSPLTNFGIDRFQADRVNGEVRAMTIRAFPAVEVFTTTIDTIDMFCVVVIDVAAGQAMHINYRETGQRPHLGKTEICRRAAVVADVVTGNLLAR